MASNAPFAARLQALKTRAAESGCSVVVASSPPNVHYLSGFFSSAYLRPLFLVIPVSGKEPRLLFPALEAALARRYAVVPWDGYTEDPERDLLDLLRPELASNSVVGIEPSAVSVGLYRDLERAVPDGKLVSVEDVLLGIREVKDQSELDRIRKAAAIGRTAATAAVQTTQIGTRELEIKAVGEDAGYREAARRFPEHRFWIWANVVAGSRTDAAGGHDLATGRAVRSGDVVFHVWLVSCDDYWTFDVQTVLVGDVSNRQRLVYRAVGEVGEAIRSELKPGTIGGEVADRARSILHGYGLDEFFGGSVGRGIGLSWAERPALATGSGDVLEPGMVLRLGCELYAEEFGGIGVGETVLITETGCESLTA